MNNNGNYPNYEFIKGTTKDQGTDFYIFASCKASLDVYSNQSDPILLQKGKPIFVFEQTHFFDYNPTEKMLPYVTLEEGKEYATVFRICKLQDDEITKRRVTKVVDPVEFKNNILHGTCFSVNPYKILISYFRYTLLCCEYSTKPLKFQATSIPVKFREPMSIFNTNNKDVICVLAFGIHGSWVLNGANRKLDNPYAFHFIDTLNKKEALYIGEGDYKSSYIPFHVYDDRIIAAVQDSNNKHEFKLVGEKKIYIVDIDELHTMNVELGSQKDNNKDNKVRSNVIYMTQPHACPMGYADNVKIAGIEDSDIANSNFTIREHVFANIEINEKEHLVFDYVGKICYFNKETNYSVELKNDGFDGKVVKDVGEVYKDENIVIIWVSTRESGCNLIKVNRNNVLDLDKLNLNKVLN